MPGGEAETERPLPEALSPNSLSTRPFLALAHALARPLPSSPPTQIVLFGIIGFALSMTAGNILYSRFRLKYFPSKTVNSKDPEVIRQRVR